MRGPLLLVISLVLAPAAASAAPAVTCHCFRNRSYDPSAPSAADGYILATTRSSLLSAVFGVPKSALVRAAMSGTPPEDLWIAHWAAPRTGRSASWLLGALAETGSWRAALAGATGLPADFQEALGRGVPSELASIAVDDVLRTRLGIGAQSLRELRGAGASSEEVVVAAFLSTRVPVSATEVLGRYKGGRATWGKLFHDAGLAPEGIDAAMRTTVR